MDEDTVRRIVREEIAAALQVAVPITVRMATASMINAQSRRSKN